MQEGGYAGRRHARQGPWVSNDLRALLQAGSGDMDDLFGGEDEQETQDMPTGSGRLKRSAAESNDHQEDKADEAFEDWLLGSGDEVSFVGMRQ